MENNKNNNYHNNNKEDQNTRNLEFIDILLCEQLITNIIKRQLIIPNIIRSQVKETLLCSRR